jgi:putative protease
MKKKAVKKVKKVKKTVKKEKISEKEVGEVSTFFSQINVAAIKLSEVLAIGDKIHFKGHTTDFKQKVSSMQIEGQKVEKGKKGQHVGIKVSDRVRPNDKVYIVK